MQTKWNEISFLVGDENVLHNMHNVKVLPVFSDIVVEFLHSLSRELMKNAECKSYVDVMSYAYWIRKSSIEQAKKNHDRIDERVGRGVAFHIAPSNVPVNFAVSMTSSLLAGNATVIRVSNKDFAQTRLICDAINFLLENENKEMKNYLCIVRYNYDSEITQMLSSMCDVRVIWGGNQTIQLIRETTIPPRAIELTFADRFSISIIDSDAYMIGNHKEIAKGFYTDTYYTDQNACSSPRIVVWMGQQVQAAKKIFWTELDELVKENYEMKPIQAIDKYSMFCSCAMSGERVKLQNGENDIVRVEVDELSESIMKYKSAGGYFFEYTANQLEEIVPILDKQCQTISFYGVASEEIKNLVVDSGVRGVDRIVPLGQTMGLEFIWDGFRMIEAMSRIIYVWRE